jgi:dTDP-4-dehydrorhamnose 3,5-epimerase
MASLTLHETPLAGLMVVETTPVGDARGSFARLFCTRELEPLGLPGPIAQINHSFTATTGTVRGLHFQRPPKAEAKLIRCLRGRVLDVAVDLRKGSPTFLKWHAVELTSENHKAFYLPQGFAHGFQTLAPDCELLYLHTEFYSPEHEGGLRFDDPALAIAWPLPAAELSARDRAHPLFGPDFTPLEIP